MTIDTKTYISHLFRSKNLIVASNNQSVFEEFVRSSICEDAVKIIIENQNRIMENWNQKNRILDIRNQQVLIPNATVGKRYEASIDFESLKLNDLTYREFKGLEDIGLEFHKEIGKIEGIPTQSGDFKIELLFKIIGEDKETPPNEKIISLVVNPDPKSLWKDVPSDRTDPFWKEDDVSISEALGDRQIVVVSKRGRSHKNVGSFRDDDFAFKHLEKSGWSVVAVSDGAGNYSLSRKGSQIACNAVIDFFENHNDIETNKIFEEQLLEFNSTKDEALLREIEVMSKKNLYQATVFVHNKIKEHAERTFSQHPELFNNSRARTILDYFHSTLIFALFKKFDFGYVILTFGVGDCPIAIMSKDKSNTTLLNWLDVGEFGGGTRFITQSSIFHSQEHPMATRFNFQIVPDFSFLFLMTDGIYDPKFVVEANLEKSENWIEFLNDLNGNNEDGLSVDFDKTNKEIASQLSNWMDFWSPGNHDDRTLAIIF